MVLLFFGNLLPTLGQGIGTGQKHGPQAHDGRNKGKCAGSEFRSRGDAQILTHADFFKRHAGDVHPARSTHFTFAIDMVDVDVWMLADTFTGNVQQILATTEDQGALGAVFNTPRQLSFFDPRLAHGALAYPGSDGIVIFVGRDFKRTGDHTVAAAHALGGVVADGPGLVLDKGADEAGRSAGRLQAMIALLLAVHGLVVDGVFVDHGEGVVVRTPS